MSSILTPATKSSRGGGIGRRAGLKNLSALAGESSILSHGTSKEKSNFVGSPRFARRPNRREFWAKKSIGGFELVKENFFMFFVTEILGNFCLLF